MIKTKNNKSSFKGLTLIELLVGMVLMLVLIPMVINFFINYSKIVVSTQDHISSVTESRNFNNSFERYFGSAYTLCTQSAGNSNLCSAADLSPVLYSTQTTGTSTNDRNCLVVSMLIDPTEVENMEQYQIAAIGYTPTSIPGETGYDLVLRTFYPEGVNALNLSQTQLSSLCNFTLTSDLKDDGSYSVSPVTFNPPTGLRTDTERYILAVQKASTSSQIIKLYDEGLCLYPSPSTNGYCASRNSSFNNSKIALVELNYRMKQTIAQKRSGVEGTVINRSASIGRIS